MGYYSNENQIDSYGINHSGFSIQDELNYQFARAERENNLIEQFKKHGLKTYPQYNTNFWGKPSDNNYGLGMNNIEIQPTATQPSYTTESAWGYPNNSQSPFYNKMGRPYNLQQEQYKLGTLSGLYESGHNYAAVGTDNAGGTSYGAYQISTNTGTMQKYLDFLQQNPTYQNFAQILNNAGGANDAKLKTQSFVNAWTKLSKDDDFKEAQYNFIVDTHLKPLINVIKEPDILRLNERHPVVKDALYSMSVQHRKAAKIVNDTLDELKREYGNNLNQISDDVILRKLYQNRINYVQNLPESQTPGDKRITKQEKMNIINNRYPYELRKALEQLK